MRTGTLEAERGCPLALRLWRRLQQEQQQQRRLSAAATFATAKKCTKQRSAEAASTFHDGVTIISNVELIVMEWMHGGHFARRPSHNGRQGAL